MDREPLDVAVDAIIDGKPLPFDWVVEYGSEDAFRALWKRSSPEAMLRLLVVLRACDGGRLVRAVGAVLSCEARALGREKDFPDEASWRYEFCGAAASRVVRGSVGWCADLCRQIKRLDIRDQTLQRAIDVAATPRPTVAETLAATGAMT